MSGFGSVITAMVTPFDDEGAVDLDGAADLARWLVEQGNDALVVTGTTGEAAVPHRRRADRRVARRAGRGRRARHRRHRHQRHPPRRRAHRPRAEAAGIDAVLVVTPYYNRPSQAGIEAHFRARRRRHRPAGDALRHPGAHRPQDLQRAAAAPGPRGAQHRRPEGRRRRPRPRPPGVIAEAPDGLRASTPATTRSPCRCSPSAPSASSAWPPTGPPR